MSRITRTVWILSLVSLFTDIASEMLYPVVPVYLKSLGYSMVWIGILEGIAEGMAGLSKGFFGKESDRSGKRLPFIKMGYALSACSKPLMAISTQIGWIFSARLTDRLGKGIRTAARDALLSQQAGKGDKGKIFGFHRGWDTAGAVIGPLVAMAFLTFQPGEYRFLFLLAFIPGLLSIILLFQIKEKGSERREHLSKGFFSYLSYIRSSPPLYRKVMAGLFLFALANSSDVFLLLRTKEIVQNDSLVIMAYIFYNIIYAVSAFPIGKWADRIGAKRMLLAGLTVFACTYLGFAYTDSEWMVFLLMGIYGLYAAATEGVAKAWIAQIVPEKDGGTAMGFHAAAQSIGLLTASTMAGWIWEMHGKEVVFLISTGLALTAMLWLALFAKAKSVPQVT
jgi:MFS family permease